MVGPRFLTIDTTGRDAVVEIWQNDELLSAGRFAPARHAQALVPGLKSVLGNVNWKWDQLDAVVVNTGPGSFTGIRVALAAAKAIVYVGGQHLIGIDQFDAFGRHVLTAGASPQLDVLIEGQLQTISAVRYTAATGREPLRTFPRSDLADFLDKDVPTIGPVKLAIPNGFVWQDVQPRLADAARVRINAGQFDDPFSLEPFYVRPSSAEEKWDAQGERRERGERRGLSPPNSVT